MKNQFDKAALDDAFLEAVEANATHTVKVLLDLGADVHTEEDRALRSAAARGRLTPRWRTRPPTGRGTSHALTVSSARRVGAMKATPWKNWSPNWVRPSCLAT